MSLGGVKGNAARWRKDTWPWGWVQVWRLKESTGTLERPKVYIYKAVNMHLCQPARTTTTMATTTIYTITKIAFFSCPGAWLELLWLYKTLQTFLFLLLSTNQPFSFITFIACAANPPNTGRIWVKLSQQWDKWLKIFIFSLVTFRFFTSLLEAWEMKNLLILFLYNAMRLLPSKIPIFNFHYTLLHNNIQPSQNLSVQSSNSSKGTGVRPSSKADFEEQ